MAAIDFSKVKSILSGMLSLLNIPKPPDPPIALPLILLSSNRPGLSAQKLGSDIIKARAEAGLPVGALPDGKPNPAELHEIIRAQKYIEYLCTEARISVAILPGTTIVATGTDATGSPVTVAGVTTSIGQGYAIIQ